MTCVPIDEMVHSTRELITSLKIIRIVLTAIKWSYYISLMPYIWYFQNGVIVNQPMTIFFITSNQNNLIFRKLETVLWM